MQIIKPSYKIRTPLRGDTILSSIEQAGRTCYKSEGDITPESAKEFCRKIIARGHHSVIEHESVSVRFIVDRGVSHELVRHRLCAFSQESTRYCNYKGGVTFIVPPWYDLETTGKTTTEVIWWNAMRASEEAYLGLLEAGWSPQQARSVLPNSLKTEIVCTANLREWRHIFSLRCASAAHPQMREIMQPLLAEMSKAIPVIFDDLTEPNK